MHRSPAWQFTQPAVAWILVYLALRSGFHLRAESTACLADEDLRGCWQPPDGFGGAEGIFHLSQMTQNTYFEDPTAMGELAAWGSHGLHDDPDPGVVLLRGLMDPGLLQDDESVCQFERLLRVGVVVDVFVEIGSGQGQDQRC
jgi:hypothetical protein